MGGICGFPGLLASHLYGLTPHESRFCSEAAPPPPSSEGDRKAGAGEVPATVTLSISRSSSETTDSGRVREEAVPLWMLASCENMKRGQAGTWQLNIAVCLGALLGLAGKGYAEYPSAFPQPEKPTHCPSLASRRAFGLSLSSNTEEREGQGKGRPGVPGGGEKWSMEKVAACTVLHWPVTVARIPEMAYRLESWYS